MSRFAALSHRGLALSTAAVAAVTTGALLVASSGATPTAAPDAAGSGATAGAESTAPERAGTRPSTDADVVRTVADEDTATEEVPGDERGVGRVREVTIDADVLPDDAAGTAQQVELELFADTTVVAELDAPEFRPEGGYRTWRGTIAGDEGSSVVLVEQDGVISGLVTDKDVTYRLRPGADGRTRVEQIDESQFPTAFAHATPPADGGFTPIVATSDGHTHPAGTPEHSHEPATSPEEHTHAPGTPAHSHEPATPAEEHTHAPGTPAHSHDVPSAATSGDAAGAAASDTATATTNEGPEISAATSDAPVVDVLIAYTSAAKARMGGQAGMDADIALMVEQTNTAFDTSGINAVLRLAHTVEVAQNGPVDGTTLSKLTNPADGVYDNVNVLRDQYGADLVALIADAPTGAYCGLAWQMNTISTSFATHTMSVTDAGCATGNTTFTHELGHNFGAAHDRGAWSGTPVLPYGYDWVNPVQRWRTVMSYANACSNCGRLLRFSNPDQTYNGAPLGAPAGAANAADNRAVLNTTASTVASMRGAPAPASLTLATPAADQQVIASTKLVATWSTTGYLGSDAKVELLRGSTVVKILAPKVALGTGRYEYLMPLTTVRASDYRLRVTPLASTAHAVTSDPFSVVDPAITPSYAPGAAAGATTRVSWTYTGTPGGTVKVELIKDGKALAALKTGAVLGTGGAGAVDVILPAALNDGGGYQFRTTLSAVPKAPAVTGTFSVSSSRALVLTAPAAGGTLTAGAPMTVTWTASGVLGTSVKAELLKGDVVVFTSPQVPVTNRTMTVTPPAKLPTGADYRIRLVTVSYPMVIATTDGALSLTGSSLTVTSQGTPGTIVAGQRLPITFTTVGVPGTAVKLEAVSPNLPPVTIVASTPIAARAYTWNVPVSLPEADWKVRATVVGNTLVTSTSVAATTVSWPQVSVSGPASAVAGAPVTVSWAFTDGAVAPVKVRLLQGTKAVATVTASGPTAADGTGSFVYRLPINLAPGNYQLEAAATVNAAMVDRTGDIAVTRPTLAAAGATSVVRGQTAALSWTFSGGAAAPVRIELVLGTKVIVASSGAATATTGTGSFVYKAPTTLAAGTYTVRIRPSALATSTAVMGTKTLTVS
jgi:hypothetical protein